MLYQLSYFRKNTVVGVTRSRIRRPDAPDFCIPNGFQWEVMDSNHRRRTPADLQSAPFGHSGNFPEDAEDLSIRVAGVLSAVREDPESASEPMEGFEPTTS